MFAIELLAPCMIIAPARFRHVGAWALIGLQIFILLTGNYAFFNVLSISLCFLLFEDSAWPRRWRERVRLSVTFNARRRPGWIVPVAVPAASFVAVLTALPLFSMLGWFQGLFRLDQFSAERSLAASELQWLRTFRRHDNISP